MVFAVGDLQELLLGFLLRLGPAGEDVLVSSARFYQSHCGGLVFFLDFAHLAWAARRADSLRSFSVSFLARAKPPFRAISSKYF